MKRYISLFLSLVMLISVVLSSVSCDDLLMELLEEPTEETTKARTDDLEETTKKKNDKTTSEEYETITERYSEDITEPPYYTDLETEYPTERPSEKPTAPSGTEEQTTEYVTDVGPDHECNDFPNTDHFCDICFVRIDDCFDCDGDYFCDVCGNGMEIHDHKCIDKTPRDHLCDICHLQINECRDKNLDHKCDICQEVLSECYDQDVNGNCDECGNSVAKNLSEFGLMSADTYYENGNVIFDGNAADSLYYRMQENDGIRGVDSIGFRGWALIRYDGSEIPIAAFGYSMNNENIIWNGEILSGDDVNYVFATKEALRYRITIDIQSLAEGRYDIYLYVCDINGVVYLMDAWNDIWVVSDGVYAPGHVCEDEDKLKDHYCDICGDLVSKCEDYDNDHICDWCRAVMSDHYDYDGDDSCDVCGINMDIEPHSCADKAPRDHNCDICGVRLSECRDKQSDHYCDICGLIMSKCTDDDFDHMCDICSVILSEHIDYDENGVCDHCRNRVDYEIHNCSDKTPRDHNCDICGVRINECRDKIEDHKCDICGEQFGCDDSNWDHMCDICGAEVSIHFDLDYDQICDYCGNYIEVDTHECIDMYPYDHFCDECEALVTLCQATESSHICTVCGNWVTECGDYNIDGYCDVCGVGMSFPDVPGYGMYTSIEEAISIVEYFEKNEYTSEKYIITGTVAEVTNDKYGNFYITDGVDTFFIYGCYSENGDARFDQMENPPKVGDRVTLYGIIGRYGEPQMKNAWIIEYFPV